MSSTPVAFCAAGLCHRGAALQAQRKMMQQLRLFLLLALLLSVNPGLSLDGTHQLQPASNRTASPPLLRNMVHVRHCGGVVYVTRYGTSGPTDDFRWKFEPALNGKDGVSIRVTTNGYTNRYLAPMEGEDPAGVPAGVPRCSPARNLRCALHTPLSIGRSSTRVELKLHPRRGNILTMEPDTDKNLVSWSVEEGLCNPGLYSFKSQSVSFKDNYLGVRGCCSRA